MISGSGYCTVPTGRFTNDGSFRTAKMPFTTVEGQNIYYQLTEPKSQRNGVTFFFIHGLGSSHAFYASIIPTLATEGYRCLAVDTPGR